MRLAGRLGVGQIVTVVMCRVDGLADVARNTRILRLRPESGRPFFFFAGQYAQVAFEGLEPRYYSMANCPGDEVFEFHIRDNGTDSVGTFVLRQLQPGAQVQVTGPLGDAWLREEHAGPLLAITGGSGLAPGKSIVDTALRRNPAQELYLYAGARNEADVYLEEHFLGLAQRHPRFRFVTVLSDPGPAVNSRRRIGMVSDAVAHDFPDLRDFKAHIAGPLPMVVATIAVLRNLNMPDGNIHADAFAAAEKAAKANKGLPG